LPISKLKFLNWIILGSIVGCSTLKPNFDHDIFPEKYNFPKTQTEVSEGSQVEQINQLKPDTFKDIINLWSNYKFNLIYHQNHPILSYNRYDLIDLYYHLNNSFKIYYINNLKYDSVKDLNQLLDRLQCIPLSNLEVRFMLNNGSISSVSNKRLTMLIISLHEALMKKGYQPVYPKIRSDYLRKVYQEPPLRVPEDFNAIDEHKDFLATRPYFYNFLFCRNQNSD
jgi:hypothetical protein